MAKYLLLMGFLAEVISTAAIIALGLKLSARIDLFSKENAELQESKQEVISARQALLAQQENIKQERCVLEQSKKELSEYVDSTNSYCNLQREQVKEQCEEYRQTRLEEIEQMVSVQCKLKREAMEKQLKIIEEANQQKLLAGEQKLLAQKKLLEAEKNKYDSVIKNMSCMDDDEEEQKKHCLQIPISSQNDINFLTDKVLPFFSNKDLIYKLIWSELVQKPTVDLLNRILSNEASGIYKITNLKNGKCYVGRSVSIRKRLTDHIKGAIGISSISDQYIHHIMMEQGLWNFKFEILELVGKDELNSREKFYIDFFKSNDIGGYNQNAGG